MANCRCAIHGIGDFRAGGVQRAGKFQCGQKSLPDWPPRCEEVSLRLPVQAIPKAAAHGRLSELAQVA